MAPAAINNANHYGNADDDCELQIPQIKSWQKVSPVTLLMITFLK